MKFLTNNELKVILEKHQLWLTTEGKEGERANLQGTFLAGANLEEVNLEGSNLEGSSFIGASLRGANLKNSNLKDSNLKDANLVGANLVCTNLTGAYLGHTYLRGANLKYANLSHSYLSDTNLQGTNLHGVILNGADLTGTDIHTFQLGRDQGFYYKKDKEVIVKIGCEEHILEYWLKNYKEIGINFKYTKEDIKRRKIQLDTIKRLFNAGLMGIGVQKY